MRLDFKFGLSHKLCKGGVGSRGAHDLAFASHCISARDAVACGLILQVAYAVCCSPVRSICHTQNQAVVSEGCLGAYVNSTLG